MKNVALLIQFGALFAFLVLGFGHSRASAQAVPLPEVAPAKNALGEESKPTEWLKAYLEAREQLHATQLAIANSRVEAATEKMEALRKTMEVERERQQAELRRTVLETERRHAEAEKSYRTMIWAAASFALAGLLALLMTPVLHARALRGAMQGVVSQPLSVPARPELVAAENAADRNVTTATERLISAIGRMEQRIQELEHTAAPAAPAIPPAPMMTAIAAPTSTVAQTVLTNNAAPGSGVYTNGTESSRRATADRAAWIAVLMNKGRSLTNANKPQEAIACYDEILHLDPKHAEAMVKKGAALERLNRFEEALETYEQAIEADERMTLAHLSKGGMCNRLGRYDEAIKSYERALQVEEKSS